MSEQAPNLETGYDLSKLAVEKRLPDAEHAEALRPGEKDPLDALRDARAEIAQTATEAPVIQELKSDAENAPVRAIVNPRHINTALRKITLSRTLHSIQRRENVADRTLSKVVHQPAVRVVSETAGNTVSRPSGILGGGLVAFTGSLVYLYLAKHIGFEYNFGVFLILFAGGFVLGLTLELLVHAATRRHKTPQN